MKFHEEQLFQLRWNFGFRRQKRQWRQAQTVQDLGVLIADWLAGRSPYLPWYVSPEPDPETLETPGLTLMLSLLNEHGYLTLVSQPGSPEEIGFDGAVWEQRAAVEFLVDDAKADVLAAATRDDGEIGVDVHPLDDKQDLRVPTCGHPDESALQEASERFIPVTKRGGSPCTVFGGGYDLHQLSADFRLCNDQLFDTLSELSCVTLFDPVWGRKDRLWPALSSVAYEKAA